MYYYDESKTFHCYTKCSCSFDIYELVNLNYKLKGTDLHFSSIVDWVAQKSGRSFGFGYEVEEKVRDTSEELNWMNNFTRKKKIEMPELKFYNDSILQVFSHHMSHPLFTNEGISPDIMDFYNICYYNKDERIVIPHRYHKNGKIIALRGRATRESDIANGVKYLPLTIQNTLYSAPTFLNLFGLFENQNNISRLRKVAIFESEKSVLQVASMYGNENNFSVALSGKNISQHQIDMLLSLNISEVILCLDKEYKDFKDDMAVFQTKKTLELGRKFSKYVQVYTVWDTEGLLETKDSPSDRGEEVLNRLLKRKQEILNIE